MKRHFKKFIAIPIFIGSFTLVGCNTGEQVNCSLCKDFPIAEPNHIASLPEHNPTTFDKSTVEQSQLVISDGVTQNTYTFKLNNGNTSKVVITEVDLSKAYIAAGTKDNSTSALKKDTPLNQLLAYEASNPSNKVVAAVNADFFGGDTPVNAFVKDSAIVKAAHNDNRIYDYTNLSADIPASMPMLFGVSGTTAQVNPIIKSESVEETIKSKLYYELTLTRDSSTSVLTNDMVLNDADGSSTAINITTNDTACAALPGSKVLTVKKHDSDSTRLHGEVTNIQDITVNTFYAANNDNFYVIIPDNMDIEELKLGDVLSYNVTSSDGTWQYYDTIIGCRQALVLDGEIAATVTLENSNGAQTTNIPRTAVGVMPNGNVAIFSVESLRYGKTSSSDSDPYGLSLPQLADFMRYYGVYSGANLDGGGSTQLITHNPTSNMLEVVVRSSDYGQYDLTKSRTVINTLLVYVKED